MTQTVIRLPPGWSGFDDALMHCPMPMISWLLFSCGRQNLSGWYLNHVQNCVMRTAHSLPRSAVTINTVSIKSVRSFGHCRLNQRSDKMPPTPRFMGKQTRIDLPQYLSSSPRSSAIDEL